MTHLLLLARIERGLGALEQVAEGDVGEAQLEEVQQLGRLGHARQARGVAHHEDVLGIHLPQQRLLGVLLVRADGETPAAA